MPMKVVFYKDRVYIKDVQDNFKLNVRGVVDETSKLFQLKDFYVAYKGD